MGKNLYVSNSPESIRLFENPILESMSKVHWSVPLYVFIPIIAFIHYYGLSQYHYGILTYIGWMLAGLFIWTITEYILHRFVFHFHPTSAFGKKVHFIFHGVHHDYPCDKLRLVLPPSVSLPLSALFFLFFKGLPMGIGFYPFFATFLTGYLVYDMFHYSIHHLEIKGKLWNVLKTHHLKHHYVNPDKGFGVSSPLWDYIADSDFATNKKATHVDPTSYTQS